MSSSNHNTYPLDPTTEINPLKHLTKSDWTCPRNVKTESDFANEWQIQHPLSQTSRNKIVWIKHKADPTEYRLIKIYKTRGNEKIFQKRYREFVFISNTVLLEYHNFYYNRKSKKIYIEMPFYGPTLTQMVSENGTINDESKVKSIAFDLLDKLWIIHNSGFVHCDIKPSNIVHFLNDELECKESVIRDGYKFIDFELMHRNHSKGKYVGTMGWSAPEIEPNNVKNIYCLSADIFSFGLIILYVLFGKNVFEIQKEQRISFINKLMKENEKITNKEIKHRFNAMWHKKISKSEYKIKNYLVRLFYNDLISLDLFELLFVGLLPFEESERWNCKQIYNCKWFDDVR